MSLGWVGLMQEQMASKDSLSKRHTQGTVAMALLCLPGYSEMLPLVQKLVKNVNSLTCKITLLKTNGKGCLGVLSHLSLTSISALPFPWFLQALKKAAVLLLGWNMKVAATGSLALGRPGLKLTNTASWRMPTWSLSIPGRSR